MARNWLLEFRRDTAANWTATNPTLAAGEPGFETDTGKLKIGDGATAWNALAYFASSAATLSVTDGVHSVANVTTVDFTSGATVSSGGAGIANVAVTGGGGVSVAFAEVLTYETTASGAYTDLATVGPAVTVAVGASGILVLGWNAQLDGNLLMSVALSGANTVAATDNRILYAAATGGISIGRGYVFTGLAAGATTVTCKYRVTGGTQGAQRRSVSAMAV